MVWFAVIAALGVWHIASNPAILWAISPHYALMFMFNQPGTTFIILGAVVLCVTGGEALYADMGHFGKQPIRMAWFAIVMPSLALNYFGQGALLLQNPDAVKNPFFLMAPDSVSYTHLDVYKRQVHTAAQHTFGLVRRVGQAFCQEAGHGPLAHQPRLRGLWRA